MANEIIKKNIETENNQEDIWHNKDQNMWRIRTSDELQAMYRKQNVFTKIKLSSLEEDKSVSAIILKEAQVRPKGPQANE